MASCQAQSRIPREIGAALVKPALRFTAALYTSAVLVSANPTPIDLFLDFAMMACVLHVSPPVNDSAPGRRMENVMRKNMLSDDALRQVCQDAYDRSAARRGLASLSRRVVDVGWCMGYICAVVVDAAGQPAGTFDVLEADCCSRLARRRA